MPPWFRHTSILWAPSITYGLLAIVAIWMGGVLLPGIAASIATVAGFVIWTLIEYFTHRFLNHPPLCRQWLDWDNHRFHHHAPDDPREFVYKLYFSGSASVLILGFWCLVAPTWTHGVAMMGGFWLGYLSYEWVHLFTHLPGRYRMPWMQRLSSLHRRHHYEGVTGCYGFVTSIWDRVFGTYS